MNLNKTNQLIEWLETTCQNKQYSLDDMKELLSISMTELADQNKKSFESLPDSIVDSIIEEMKTNGEFYLLEKKIKHFKLRFSE